MLSTALGREAQHGNPWVSKSGNALGSLCGADSNLGKLVGIRHRSYGNVTNDENAILTILFLLRDKQHTATYACNAGSTLDNLQCGTQGVASSAERT